MALGAAVVVLVVGGKRPPLVRLQNVLLADSQIELVESARSHQNSARPTQGEISFGVGKRGESGDLVAYVDGKEVGNSLVILEASANVEAAAELESSRAPGQGERNGLVLLGFVDELVSEEVLFHLLLQSLALLFFSLFALLHFK